jgi:hypothetical protein
VALLTVLLLCVLALLASLYAHRALLSEVRGAQVSERSAQARQAAQSGLDWALSQLNGGGVDEACRPAAGAPRLDERLIERWNLRLSPRLDAAGTPLRAGCTLAAEGGWACRCTGDGAPAAVTEAPSFGVHAEGTSRSGLVRLVAGGCLGCGSGALDAWSRAETLLALVPALTGLPAAPLTVRGTLRLQGFDLDLSTRERDQQGLLLHAGGVVDAPGVAPLDGSGRTGTGASSRLVADRDAALALPPGRFLHRYLGLEPADYARAPGVETVRCGSDCAEALQAAVARGAQALWVEGPLSLPAGARLGSADAPVLLAAQGEARLGPGLRMYGVLAAAGLRWHARPGGDFIRGAVLVNGDCCEGSGAPEIERDAALVRLLARQAGRFIPVPGSWKDVE